MDGLTQLLTKIGGLLSGFSAAWLGPAVLAFVSVPLPGQRIMKLLSGEHGSSPHGCWPWAGAGGKKRHGPVLQQWRLSWGGCWGKQQRARWPGGGNGLKNDPAGQEMARWPGGKWEGIVWGRDSGSVQHVFYVFLCWLECLTWEQGLCSTFPCCCSIWRLAVETACHLPQLSVCGMPHPVCMQSGSLDPWEWVLWAGARMRMVLLRFLPVSTVMAVGHHERSEAQLKRATGCSLLGMLAGGGWWCVCEADLVPFGEGLEVIHFIFSK